jgi:hypothetical protein
MSGDVFPDPFRNNPPNARFVCRATLSALVRGPARHPPNAPYMPGGAVLFFGS